MPERHRVALQLGLILAVILGYLVVAPGTASAVVSPDIVISVVYTAGGTATPTFANDFVELYNPTDAAVSVAGWSVQIASAMGTSWSVTALSGSIPARSYYLVQETTGGAGQPLPQPDASAANQLATGAGKVALVTTTTALTCGSTVGSCSAVPTVRDFVGYGTVSDRETTAVATLSVSVSAQRTLFDGSVDTDNNSRDFVTALPTPRNSLPIPSVVVSEIYGGGGSLGVYNRDFVELYNAGSSPANVTGYSVQYGAATGTTWTATALAGTIAPGGYYLVALGPSGGGTPLPAPIGASNSTVNMAVNAGKVAVFLDASPIQCTATCAATPGVLDFVGYGVANDAETTPTLAPAQRTSVQRTVYDGTVDTGNNRLDFSVADPTPNAALAAPLRIPAIQGPGHTSPYVGQRVVRVAGVLTALAADHFWMQDPTGDGSDLTSDGILVRATPTGLAVGDSVSVDATVVENQSGTVADHFLTVTELGSPTVSRIAAVTPITPTLIGPGGRVPPSTVVDDDGLSVFQPDSDGIDFYESLEGTAVRLVGAEVVGPTSTTGQLVVVPAGTTPRTPRGGVFETLTDANPERLTLDGQLLSAPGLPAVNVGDRLTGTVAGPLDYAGGQYLLLPTAAPVVQNGGLTAETTAPTTPGQLSTATYNVRNLSAVDPASRFTRTAQIIVTNLQAPDIVSLEEIQDNDGPGAAAGADASQTIARLVAAIAAVGGPAYSVAQIDPVVGADGGVAGANIRTVLLYRTDRGLSFVAKPGGTATTPTTVSAGPAALSVSPGLVSPADPAFTGSRKPLAAQFVYAGQSVFVVAVHFTSKVGDDPLYGSVQPPAQPTEAVRVAQATVVNSFVDEVLAADPAANVVVLGDLNDAPYSATVAALQGDPGAPALTNLMARLPVAEQYSYVFQGNSEALSNVLASPSLAAHFIAYDSVHVNAEFAVQESDHDPQVAVFGLPAPVLGLTLLKSGPAAVDSVGDQIDYEFVVTNTSTVALTGVTVAEETFTGTGAAPVPVCPASASYLPAGGSVTCTASYAVTQADLDAGSIRNTASATSATLSGAPVASGPSTVTVTVTTVGGPALALTAAPPTYAAVGDTVVYTYVVTNASNVTLTDVGVRSTAFDGAGTAPAPDCGAAVVSLAPGASVTCTASYVVTQQDLDAGSVGHSAVASGRPSTGAPIDSAVQSATVTAAQSASLVLAKTVTPTTVTTLGATVVYSYLVTNSGNVTLTDVGITESEFTGTGLAPTPSCPVAAAQLAPGNSVTCTASYVVVQGDLDQGAVDNTAVATATGPTLAPVSSNVDSALVTLPQTRALAFSLTVAPASVTTAGETVRYTYTATNGGNVSLTEVSVATTGFTGSGPAPAPACGGSTSLLPGVALTCTAAYVVTQADVDAGTFLASAQATGTAPDGEGVGPTVDSVTVLVPAAAQLALTGTADPTTAAAAGTPVSFAFLVTNTGNVTVTGATVAATAFTGSGPAPALGCPAGAAALAPAAAVTCTATYVLTQADVDAGSVTFTAAAGGTPPGGAPVTSGTAGATVTVSSQPAVAIAAAVAPTPVGEAGTPVVFSFDVTNPGNVTLGTVAVSGTGFTGSGPAPAVSCPAPTLAPGQPLTCTASYVLSQADIDAGSVAYAATVSATSPTGTQVTATSAPATVLVDPRTGLSVVVSAGRPDVDAAGQTVTLSLLVTNTGNLSLTLDTTTLGLVTGSGVLSVVSCPAPAPVLGPFASVTCTASYVVAQADVDRGGVTVAGSATATDPAGGLVVAPPSDLTIASTPRPALVLVKAGAALDVGADGVVRPGDRITWSFVVGNAGNVTLTDVVVNDPTGGAVACPRTVLAPGASMTCTASDTHLVTAADAVAGVVTNVASATARVACVPAGAVTDGCLAVASLPAAARIAVGPGSTAAGGSGSAGGGLAATGVAVLRPAGAGVTLLVVGLLLLLAEARSRRRPPANR